MLRKYDARIGGEFERPRIQLHPLVFFFPLWLYSPSLYLGRLHETSRFISFTRSRTVGSTPRMGDQLVARPLVPAPGDCDDGEVGGMNGFGRGNRSTRKKPAPTPLYPPQIHLPDPGANPSRRGRKPENNRFSYGAASFGTNSAHSSPYTVRLNACSFLYWRDIATYKITIYSSIIWTEIEYNHYLFD
jgi:hypothetical protein